MGGEEGKSLYGGASERGESAGGAQPSLGRACHWLSLLAVDADFAKWADGTKYRYLLQHIHYLTRVCTATLLPSYLLRYPGSLVHGTPLSANFFFMAPSQPTLVALNARTGQQRRGWVRILFSLHCLYYPTSATFFFLFFLGHQNVHEYQANAYISF